MSHHLRHQNNCLNCGAEVNGRYCSVCGQENVEPKETFGTLVHHFVGDVTHYDAQFLATLKYLLFRPGFLTREYLAGRRMKYLNPIRMYIFISVLFFLALFLKKDKDQENAGDGYNIHYVNRAKQQVADSLQKINAATGNAAYDSIRAVVIKDVIKSLDTTGVRDTTEAIGFSIGDKGVQFTLVENRYNTVAEYDSAQASLPAEQRDKGLFHWMLRTNISLKSRYGERSQVVVAENFEHSLPKVMFVLLPLFAWFVYIFHNRKKFYYAQHAIFSVHYHSFMFSLLLLIALVTWIFPHLNELVVLVPAFLLLFIYLASALKKTYAESLFSACLKTVAIGILYIISLVICIIALAFINFFTA